MIEACSLILLLLLFRIVSSFISDFPVLMLPHTKKTCVARIGISLPATVDPDAVLPGESRPELPDLKYYKYIADVICI